MSLFILPFYIEFTGEYQLRFVMSKGLYRILTINIPQRQQYSRHLVNGGGFSRENRRDCYKTA